MDSSNKTLGMTLKLAIYGLNGGLESGGEKSHNREIISKTLFSSISASNEILRAEKSVSTLRAKYRHEKHSPHKPASPN